MNINNNYIKLESELIHHRINCNHSHILCPYNFCSCICCICNYCYGCQCICHQLKTKTTRNNLDTNEINNISTKAPLFNYSNELYFKDKYQIKNDIDNISYDNNSNLKSENSNRALFHDKLNFKTESIKNCGHSRSLSELSIRNNKINNEYLTNNKKKHYSRSYMSDFYKYNNLYKRQYYNPSTERENLLTKDRFKNNDNFTSIKGDKSEEKYLKKNDSLILNYDNYYKKTIDINNNNKNVIEDYYNIKNLNNYRKKNKYRSYLNSIKKKDKIIDNLIKNKKRKDVYINLEPNKNKLKTKTENYIKYTDKNIYNNNDFFSDRNTIYNNMKEIKIV